MMHEQRNFRHAWFFDAPGSITLACKRLSNFDKHREPRTARSSGRRVV